MGANGPVDHCLAPTVVERRAHAFGNNVAFSDWEAAPACRRQALFCNRKLRYYAILISPVI